MSENLSEFGDELIGKVFQDRFEVVQPIGSGGMGAVYLGRQLSIDRDVAIKVLRRGLPENARDRFMREARVVSEMSHPGIVQMIDFGNEDDLYFLVMEMVDGISLEELLEGGRLHPSLALLIADQVTSALAEAHARGVIHRDLKPGNIILTVNAGGEPQAKLLDFGIAYNESDPRLTQSGTLCGTPAYMAPEQAQGREVMPATDFYALGINLYQMLAGRLPFLSKTPVGVLLKHLQQKPPTLRAHVDVGVIPESAVALTERLLKKEIGNRPATARELRKLIAEARAPIGAGPLIVEGRPREAFSEFVFPPLTENPNADVSDARGLSFLDTNLSNRTGAEDVDLATVPTRPDTREREPIPKNLVHPGPTRPNPAVGATANDPGARAWAAFEEASSGDGPDPRTPRQIDPNLWSMEVGDHMASFSDNSLEIEIPESLFSIQPQDSNTKERSRLAFAQTVGPQDPIEPKKSAARESLEDKRPDWLQSAQESMEYEIQKPERTAPALPPEPENLPELPPEETGETKFLSNILFILLTIFLVAGMAFIGMELFVKPAKRVAPPESRELTDPDVEEEVDRFPPTQIQRKDDPARRIGPKSKTGAKKDSFEEGSDEMKERLRNIDDVRYRKPIEIFESEGVNKGTRDIQDL